ncbi:MAG: glycerophosphodiester phosphodiesterase [Acidobacteriota bacterium]|nr:glycerophosphodiester phosphodiesterase [Acidobacteriota bacterium]
MHRRRGSLPPLFATDRPLVFAHRGGAKLAPENTLEAFARGLAHGADGLELDVHLSRDGVPVVIHDQTVDRTTDATGEVGRFTAAELAAIDAGARFAPGQGFPFRGRGHGVPTLETVLARCPDCRVIIEMKFGHAALARAVVAVVERLEAGARVCLSSFQQEALDVARAIAPRIATSASVTEARRALHRAWLRWPFVSEQPYAAFQVPERTRRLRVVSPTFIRRVHREGQVLQVWVVDTEDDADRLLDWGVDGLITDRPDVIVPARDRWMRAHTRTAAADAPVSVGTERSEDGSRP